MVSEFRFTPRYVEHGKIFLRDGATDYLVLSYSDPESAELVNPFRKPNLFDLLDFPELADTPFTKEIGKVSVGLLRLFSSNYLFAQIQRRREGELSSQPKMNRPFNQIRFYILDEKTLSNGFQDENAIYSAIIGNGDGKSFSLRTYFEPKKNNFLKCLWQRKSISMI